MEWLLKAITWLKKYIKKHLFLLLFLITILLPILIVLILASYFAEPIPTQIQIDLLVNQMAFVINEKKPTTLNSIKFDSVTIRNFSYIEFILKTADNQSDKAEVITIRDKREMPVVSVESEKPDEVTNFGVLHELLIKPKLKVFLKLTDGEKGKKELGITVENYEKYEINQSPFALLSHKGNFKLSTLYCDVKAVNLPLCKADSCVFEIPSLSDKDPFIRITGGESNSLNFVFTYPSSKSFDIFPKGISITAPDFIREDMVNGIRKPKTTLIERGEISYPEYPTIERINFEASTFIDLGKHNEFNIEKVAIDSESEGIKVRLSGLAKEKVTTYCQGSPTKNIDYRLTRSDTYDKRDQMAANIISWLIPLIVTAVSIVVTVITMYPSSK